MPSSKAAAISELTIWSGFKAFIEFETAFYENEYAYTITPETDGEKIYYNAALGQNTNKNIVGLFSIGKPALDFTGKTGDELKNYILNDLDQIYNNQATPNYIKHVTQNWNNEPFIMGGYLSDHADWRKVKILGESVENKIYFAGGEYTNGENWVSVNTAAMAAQAVVTEITA